MWQTQATNFITITSKEPCKSRLLLRYLSWLNFVFTSSKSKAFWTLTTTLTHWGLLSNLGFLYWWMTFIASSNVKETTIMNITLWKQIYHVLFLSCNNVFSNQSMIKHRKNPLCSSTSAHENVNEILKEVFKLSLHSRD
jgi:hypothetical protein